MRPARSPADRDRPPPRRAARQRRASRRRAASSRRTHRRRRPDRGAARRRVRRSRRAAGPPGATTPSAHPGPTCPDRCPRPRRRPPARRRPRTAVASARTGRTTRVFCTSSSQNAFANAGRSGPSASAGSSVGVAPPHHPDEQPRRAPGRPAAPAPPLRGGRARPPRSRPAAPRRPGSAGQQQRREPAEERGEPEQRARHREHQHRPGHRRRRLVGVHGAGGARRAEEHPQPQPGRVPGGDHDGQHADAVHQPGQPAGVRRGRPGVQDRVLAPEPGQRRQPDQRAEPDRHAPEGGRHPAPQAAHRRHRVAADRRG